MSAMGGAGVAGEAHAQRRPGGHCQQELRRRDWDLWRRGCNPRLLPPEAMKRKLWPRWSWDSRRMLTCVREPVRQELTAAAMGGSAAPGQQEAPDMAEAVPEQPGELLVAGTGEEEEVYICSVQSDPGIDGLKHSVILVQSDLAADNPGTVQCRYSQTLV
ncbi:hypothetical protein chiPu_0020990 [Chiloscyllium punctatum]|uniref:Uncharacterized protein n=1 Tax=Chiloscyllium punctatum TaxID=137246 RepID=A0A401RLY5_CHIPU|nr:hypothetical protein [Chiloscyllium punctatum]